MSVSESVQAVNAADARFWDRIADRYAKQPVADAAAYETKLRVTQSYLEPEMELLEFGCGTGTTAIAHAPHVRHILGTDLSERMVEIARDKAKAAGVSNVTFRCVDFASLDEGDARYDAVLGMSVLHLLADHGDAIQSVHRLLRPSGLFITSTPCLSDSYSYLRLVAPIAKWAGFFPPVVRFFSERELVASLTGRGFEILHHWKPGKKAAVFIVARKTA